ncbi:MAG: ferritin [Candidatus Latescibacteria bacterium]|nr:ferritin [Candidatus Latescibacterota bacterium]
MASKQLMEMMNQAIARELQVAVQYMWQHVMWKGVKGFAVKDELKAIGIAEMKHAEAIAERLAFFGGTPTTKPSPIFIGKNLKEMLMADKKDEEGAIKLYRDIIKLAAKEEDHTTKKLFKSILGDEEEHLDTFSGLLEEI